MNIKPSDNLERLKRGYMLCFMIQNKVSLFYFPSLPFPVDIPYNFQMVKVKVLEKAFYVLICLDRNCGQ